MKKAVKMVTTTERAHQIRIRAANILKLDEQGWSAAEIAVREGLDLDNAEKLRKAVCAEAGRKPNRLSKNSKVAYGLSPDTRYIRAWYRTQFGKLMDKLNNNHTLIARLTGIPIKRQNKLEGHDWKMSEIERLARALDRDVREFIQEAQEYERKSRV